MGKQLSTKTHCFANIQEPGLKPCTWSLNFYCRNCRTSCLNGVTPFFALRGLLVVSLTKQLISGYLQRIFSQASPEAILYDVSAVEKTHRATSSTKGVVKKLQPFIEAVEQYGAALDVYSNIYPLVMGPIWGSVRVVLHV